MKGSILLGSLFFLAASANSQSVIPDPAFGKRGIVIADLGAQVSYNTAAQKVLVPPDGSLYVLAQLAYESLISKRSTSGVPDVTYGNNGFSSPIPFKALQAVLQSDNKIVVTGLYKKNNTTLFGIARLTTAGILDTSFNGSGLQTTNFGSDDNQAIAITIDKNDKIIVAGFASTNEHFDFAIARYNKDGSLDKAFSEDGLQTTNFGNTDDFCQSIIVQADGKIVAAGYNYDYVNSDFKIAIARYNSDGTPDKLFGKNGRVNTENGFAVPNGAAIQMDGKLLVISKPADYMLLRYNTDGTLDDTFGNGGKLAIDFSLYELTEMVIQNDKKIIIAGHGPFFNSDFLVARFTADGKPDNTFSEDGKAVTDFGSSSEFLSSIAIQNDGKIIAAGVTQNGSINTIAIARYTGNGNIDESFGKNGKLTDHFSQGLTTYNASVIQSDGKLITAGSVWNGNDFDFVISRYNDNGSLDNSFNKIGYQTVDFGGGNDYVNSLVIQKDGKVIAAGYSGTTQNSLFAIARLNADGSADQSFDEDGKTLTHFNDNADIAYIVALQKNEKIVVAGSSQTEFNSETNKFSSDFVLARYNTDGSPDATFGFDGLLDIDLGGDDIAQSMVITKEDKIIIGGYSQTFNETGIDHSSFATIRLTPDGILDESFSDDGISLESFDGLAAANAIALQPDEKILAAGIITNALSKEKSLSAVRYNADGTFDDTFNGSGLKTISSIDGDITVNAITLQKNGKIILGGSLNNDAALWRLNSDGSADQTFGSDGVLVNTAFATDDKIESITLNDNRLYTAGIAQVPGSAGVVAGYLLAEASETSPSVNIIKPVDKATFISPVKNLEIKATATDADGQITKVDFYNGKILLHIATEAPYAFTWKNVPAGNYTITVVATDNSGLTTTSDPVHIAVEHNKAPEVSFIKPTANHIYPAPATIRLEADASDPDGRITKVEFYNGAVLLQKEYKAPYTFKWQKVPIGKYTIIAKAFDNWGATTSASVNISVEKNKAPIVNITSPKNNESFTCSATVHLAATASDANGRITKVEFYNGSILLHTEYKLPYTYQWQNLPAGTYTVTAVATDNYGKQTTSAPVTFTVSESAPVITKALTFKNAITATTISGLRLSPNPAKDMINVFTDELIQSKPVILSIINSSGIVSKRIRTTLSGKTLRVDVSSLPGGSYTLQLKSGNKVLAKQFIKL